MDLNLENQDEAFRDMLTKYGKKISEISQSPGLDRDSILRQVQNLTTRLVRAFSTEERNLLSAVEISERCQIYFEKLCANVDAVLSSGMPDLDRLLQRFEEECVYLFCARPGQGKTSMLLTIARNMLNAGKCVYIASAEMSAIAIGQRLIAYYASFPVCYQSPGLSRNDFNRLYEGSVTLGEKSLYTNDTPCMAIETIDDDLRHLRDDQNIRPDSVMIDYVQLVTSRAVQDQSDGFKVGTAVSKYTTLLAKKYRVPVICAAQQNRESDKRSTKSAKLSDLRGTGQLEQDAHFVAYIHNERPLKTTDERVLRISNSGDVPTVWECDIQVEKHRNGPAGWAKLTYNAPFMEFGELR